MPVRIGLIGSGFVSNFYMLGLRDVAGWEMPVVASPIPSYAPVMQSGVEGFFAATREEWLDRLDALRDPALRRRMGERARETVLQRYSMEEQARLLIRILRGLIRDDADALQARTC